MPYKNPTGYTKPFTRYSDNDKMNTSGMSNEMPMDVRLDEIEIFTVGPITQYGSGGTVYSNKNDKDTKIKMKDLESIEKKRSKKKKRKGYLDS